MCTALGCFRQNIGATINGTVVSLCVSFPNCSPMDAALIHTKYSFGDPQLNPNCVDTSESKILLFRCWGELLKVGIAKKLGGNLPFFSP